MKKLLFLFSALLLLGLCHAETSFVSKTIGGKYTKIITTVLDGNHYVISSVSESSKPLKDLVSQVGGFAGINGAYFCPSDYPNCGGTSYTYAYRKFLDYQDNDIYGQNNKTIFGISYTGVPVIKTKTINSNTNIAFGISNFPAILIDGVDSLDYEGLSEKNIAKGIKAFICSNKSGDTIRFGFVYNIELWNMPNYIKTNFQCWNALNLDGGGSLALRYGTEYSRQGRNIMDAFVVVTSGVWNRLMSGTNNGTATLFTGYIASPYSGMSWDEYRTKQTLSSYYRHKAKGDYVKIVNGGIVSMPRVVCPVGDAKCEISKNVHLQLFDILTRTH